MTGKRSNASYACWHGYHARCVDRTYSGTVACDCPCHTSWDTA